MRMFKGSAASSSEEWHFPQARAFATSGIRSSAVVSITRDKEIITGGHVDNSVRLVSSDGAKTLEIARGHCAPVTCLALSPDSNYLVTGSRDATVLLWRIHRSSTPRPSSTAELSTGLGEPSPASGNPIASNLADKSRRRRFEGPIHVLRGHLGEIICCSVSSDLGIVVSCSNSSDVLLHSIRRGCLIRRLVGVKANVVCPSSDGIVIAWNESLHTLSTFTLNGTLIALAQLPFSSSFTCMEVSFDGRSVLIGLNSCLENGVCDNNDRLNISTPSICFFDLHTLKVFHSMQLREGQEITTLALNKDNTNLWCLLLTDN